MARVDRSRRACPGRAGARAVIGPALAIGLLVVTAAPLVFDFPSSSGGWWRRRDDAGQAAGAARDAASDAFYEMDRAQRFLRTRIEAFANLDGGPHGRQVKAELAQLNVAVDNASREWIDTLDRHAGLEGSEGSALAVATDAFGRLTRRMHEVRTRIDAFAAAHAGDFARLEAALGEVPVRAAAARDAVDAARDAVDAAHAADMRPTEAAAALGQAEAALATVDQGAQAHGVQASLRAAEEAVRLAESARRAAEELPRRRESVRRELTAVRTRLEVLAHKAAGIESTMSRLRRGYVHRAWGDVEKAGSECRGALARATELVTDAEGRTAPVAQQWDAAMDVLQQARDQLRVAAAAEEAVTGRLDALEQAAEDPAGEVAGARFTLRDAQRLIMGDGGPRDQALVRALDALAARLDDIAAIPEDNHPDYWRFLTEIESVRSETGRIVEAIRANRAAR